MLTVTHYLQIFSKALPLFAILSESIAKGGSLLRFCTGTRYLLFAIR